MHLDPISLNLFVAVVEEGPIAAAAGREHLAAAISRRMAELEQALGSPLRLHHARGIEPTAAGLALHVLDDIPVPLRDLATFAQAHPHVRILLEESNSPATVRAVAENAADVGVYTAFAHGDTVQSLPYRQDRPCVVVPKPHPLAQGSVRRRGVAFADLLDDAFVGLRTGSAINLLLAPRQRGSGARCAGASR